MRSARTPAPAPFRFQNLPAFTRQEVALWNWYCRVAPGRTEWKTWVTEILGHLLEKPVSQQIQLTQTNLVDAKFGEKVLSFGSKQQLLLGRAADNDIVLSASAISSKHARLLLQEGHAYLEDFDGRLGTYLWDKRIAPTEKHLLGNGDQFTIFPYRFRVLVETTFAPETDVTLGDCRVLPLTRAEFLKMASPGARTFVLCAQPGDGEALVEINPSFLEAIQKRILSPLRLDRIKAPVPSDETFLGFVMLAFLERVNRRMKFPTRFSFVKAARKVQVDAMRGMFLSFCTAVGGITGTFRIFLPLDLLSRQAQEAAGELAIAFPSVLSWRFPISVASVDLTLEEIAQIGLGDILVTQPGAALLLPNDFSRGWTMVDEGSNFVRFRVDKYLEGGMPVESGEATSGPGQAAVEHLPLRLHVVLGERELTLAEVQSLNPGTIIEFDANKAGPVRLMVNGRILGEGELVEVEGKLAVKVLGWRSA